MLNVVSVNWKNYQQNGVTYTNILFDSIRRNLPEGMLGRFVCFTDDLKEEGYHPAIELRQLPDGLNGYFNKLYLFKDGLFEPDDRILYFDLGCVITGPLDEIAAYDGPFAILRDFYRPGGLQSSVMSWRANTKTYIWSDYERAGFPEVAGGDQAWIEHSVERKSTALWQEEFPSAFCSYKVHARWGIPKGTKIVCFHGQPKPKEAGGWVDKVWKIGGGTSAELLTIANVSERVIKSNILQAEANPFLEWLSMKPPHDRTALICAGGPSLRESFSSITAHHSRGARIFAVNGTYKYLRSVGLRPSYHVILDARKENIAFVPQPTETVQRLYSSQCDPMVLRAKGAKVTAWHPLIEGVPDLVGKDKRRDYVGGGTTAGMKAIAIAYMLGYRNIHLYGFDSSYSGSDHHSYPQSLNDGERVLDVMVGDKSFRAAPWMIQQAEDFETFAPQLLENGCTLTVHGEGLIPYMASVAMDGPVKAADLRARAILQRLNGHTHMKGAEIGVFAGDLSKRLLMRKEDLSLIMVDSWASDHSSEYVASGDFHASLSKEEQERFYDMTRSAVAFAGDRARILRMPSIKAAERTEDGTLDFVFIDADHSYEAVKADLQAWFPKVKPGGIVSGHDYANTEFPCFGVKEAVDEFVKEKNLTLDLGENFTWFAVKPNEGEIHV